MLERVKDDGGYRQAAVPMNVESLERDPEMLWAMHSSADVS